VVCCIEATLVICNGVCAAAHHETGRPTVDRAEVEALQHEWRHQEDIMQRIADASTPEGHVAHKAYRRISELVDELKLDEGHTELAHQVHNRPHLQVIYCTPVNMARERRINRAAIAMQRITPEWTVRHRLQFLHTLTCAFGGLEPSSLPCRQDCSSVPSKTNPHCH